ncbi:hypothetical protein BS47DRAFT_1481326 [Hydnum rufescens UP504]|uniref:Uncharacterized protein n=1 Tax=Hydnum rufescens UP504 TaxID=1448309 RepID=A0A9P6E2P0_9AGAM|nr:hypothetical protein BS47DRAFT_1481326 [Hydnum rufescens UP504]
MAGSSAGNVRKQSRSCFSPTHDDLAPVAPRSLALAKRHIQIESIPASSQEILDRQRLRRPSSPHFTIYQPQLTWIGSIAHRISGVGLSVAGLYAFLLAYLGAPVVGIPLDSAHIVEFVQGVPEWIKYTPKASSPSRSRSIPSMGSGTCPGI